MDPSLGSPFDRQALIRALADNLIQAIAVQATPLDDEECLLPPDQRSRGVSGHHLVLPSLWQTLVVDEDWTPEQLWQVVSFGPSKVLGVMEECLAVGSDRWLLFDPEHSWTPSRADPLGPRAAFPWQDGEGPGDELWAQDPNDPILLRGQKRQNALPIIWSSGKKGPPGQ